jgi:hypothetical protein
MQCVCEAYGIGPIRQVGDASRPLLAHRRESNRSADIPKFSGGKQ